MLRTCGLARRAKSSKEGLTRKAIIEKLMICFIENRILNVVTKE